MNRNMKTSEIQEEFQRQLENIESKLKEGSIITAAWLTKKLAVKLDNIGFAEPLETMLRCCKE